MEEEASWSPSVILGSDGGNTDESDAESITAVRVVPRRSMGASLAVRESITLVKATGNATVIHKVRPDSDWYL